VYEVTFLGNQSSINKLYLQSLNSEEIGLIVENMGSWLLDIVENIIETN
jgi:hypothetical protein